MTVRRLWTEARPRAEAAGWAVVLDERPLATPGKAPLVVPTRALAEAIAGEWSAAGETIDPVRMPLTRAANSSIDKVAPEPDRVVDALAAYGETDLVCHRAAAPEALRRRQEAAWDPLLDWAARDLSAPLAVVTGVIHAPQPPGSAAALRRAVAAHGPFRLAGLSELVALSGSLVIGLAVSRGMLPAPDAWPLSRIDEDWQAERWGWDAEAAAAAEARRADFLQAAAFLRLLDP